MINMKKSLLRQKTQSFYSETCLNQTSRDQLLYSEKTGIQFIQIKLTNISNIGGLFKVRFIQDSALFRVQYFQDL